MPIFVAATRNTITEAFRWLFSALDSIVYSLTSLVANLMLNIADIQISDGFVNDLLQRLFIVIAVFMLFKLAFSLLNGIVNPDSLTDKQSGMQKIIPRTLVALMLLVMLNPIFDIAYRLQKEVIAIMPSVILGTTGVSTEDTSPNSDHTIGNTLAASVLNAFVTESDECENGGQLNENVLQLDLDATVDAINEACPGDNSHFRYEYSIVFSTIFGIVIMVLLLSLCLDIAIRAVKLMVLQVIAPIPIISYIDPKSQKDGAFNGWIKNCISTYLDLFLKLAIIFLGLSLILGLFDLDNSAFVTSDGTALWLQQPMVIIFLVIGIIFFMKQAPSFIKDILGVKGASNSVGLGGLFAATAAVVGGAGLAGAVAGFATGATNAADANAQGKQAPGAWSSGSDLAARLRTGDANAKGGLTARLQRSTMNRAEARAQERAGVSDENIAKQKGIVDAMQNDVNAAQFDLDNARARWSSFDVGTDPGEWTESEPTAPEVTDYRDAQGNFDQTSYDAAQNKYYQQNAEYRTRYQQWEQRRNDYDARVAQKDSLYADVVSQNDRFHAAQERLAKENTLLDDMKTTRKAYSTDKAVKYTARNPAKPGATTPPPVTQQNHGGQNGNP